MGGGREPWGRLRQVRVGVKRAVVILAVAATACLPVSDVSTTSTVPSTSTTGQTGVSSPTTTDTGVDPTTTSSVPPGDVLALIAPSGVPVAVVDFDGTTYHVITPCGDEASLTGGTPLTTVDVVIDPGHGGPIDTGAVGRTGLKEKEINLSVGMEVAEILNARGIATMLTRAGDYPVPIPTRAQYADMVGARALVSIHHNAPSANPSDTPGTEIFVQNDTPESSRLGGLIYESVTSGLGVFDVKWSRASDAGVMTVLNPEGSDAYGMIRRPQTVSTLVELGYISNPPEAELFGTPAYVAVASKAVADGIESFLNSDAPGSGFVEGRVFSPQSGVGKDQCIEPDLEQSLYPDVVGVDVQGTNTLAFEVTVSSPYDSSERYADGFRVVGDDGKVYGQLELTNAHPDEQPFTRVLDGVSIPDEVATVTVQARDSIYGWGGGSVIVDLGR